MYPAGKPSIQGRCGMSTHVLCRQVSFQSPRGIDVSESRHEIRNVGVGEPLIGPRASEVDWFTVDFKVDLTQGDQVQASGCHDDVGL